MVNRAKTQADKLIEMAEEHSGHKYDPLENTETGVIGKQGQNFDPLKAYNPVNYMIKLKNAYNSLMDNLTPEGYQWFANQVTDMNYGSFEICQSSNLVQKLMETRLENEPEEKFWHKHIFDFALMDYAFKLGLSYNLSQDIKGLDSSLVLLGQLYSESQKDSFIFQAPRHFQEQAEKHFESHKNYIGDIN